MRGDHSGTEAGSFGENARDYLSRKEALGEGLQGTAWTRWSAEGPDSRGRRVEGRGDPRSIPSFVQLISLTCGVQLYAGSRVHLPEP